MISSKVIDVMMPLFDIIKQSKGKTIGEIKQELNIEREKMKKGASGLIVENLLGIKNNNIADADIPEIGCEVKILPLQKNKNGEIKAKEPTAIQMINYFEVANETWENANLQAGVFARHVMNVEHPVANPAWFWTDQLSINYQFVGDMAAAEWLVRGEINPELRQESSFVLFGVTDGVIVGGITVNAAKEMRHLKKLISKQAAFEADKYLDISQDLRKLVK